MARGDDDPHPRPPRRGRDPAARVRLRRSLPDPLAGPDRGPLRRHLAGVRADPRGRARPHDRRLELPHRGSAAAGEETNTGPSPRSGTRMRRTP